MDSDFTKPFGEVIMVRSEHREKTLEEWSLSLLGRFHTTELINFRAAENHLRSTWKMEGNNLKITDVGDGLFRFKFSMESQLKWVIDNGPWSFDNQILLLRRWEKGMTASSVNFQTVPMWVQVWELPFDLINKEAGRDIGQGIGRVIEVDCRAIDSGEARFLRVRVDVPLDKPIRREATVLNPEGDTVRVVFKYERLCGLCFHCGLLGHEAKACKKVGEESPYGEWLRATEDVPPQTSDSHQDGNPNGHGIDGAETEPLQNFNSGNGHSYHSTTHSSLVEEANPSNTNNEDLITTFCEITSSTREEALSYLESHNFHLDSAVSTFLDININPAAVAHPIIPSAVAQSHQDGNPNGHGIDGAETEPQQNFNDGKNPEINAIPAHQNYMPGKSSSESKWKRLKWKRLKQKLGFDPKLLLSQGIRWLFDAIRLLLTNPTVKSLVVSLASDKAVQDAILRCMSVREFQWTPYADEEPGWARCILMWIWDRIKAEFGEFLPLVNELFQPPKSNNPTEGNKEQMEENRSLLLSVVILLLVVVALALTG